MLYAHQTHATEHKKHCIHHNKLLCIKTRLIEISNDYETSMYFKSVILRDCMHWLRKRSLDHNAAYEMVVYMYTIQVSRYILNLYSNRSVVNICAYVYAQGLCYSFALCVLYSFTMILKC